MYKYKCQVCKNIEESNEPPHIIHICNRCGKVDTVLYSIDMSHTSPKDIVRIATEELMRRDSKMPISIKYEWTTKTGEKTYFHKMTETHLKNIINLIKEKCVKIY